MNIGGTSDPYVMVTLQPGAAHSVLKTEVIKKNLNPVFNETFITMVKFLKFKDITDVFSSSDFQRRKKVAVAGQFWGVLLGANNKGSENRKGVYLT